MARIRATLFAVTLSMAFGMPATVASAQSAPQAEKKEAAPKKKRPQPATAAKEGDKKGEAAGAQKQIDAAQKSLDAGKADVAVNQINAVLAQTGLDARSVARSLVIRGQAYRKLAKPAQAMADLQSAVQLRGGLNDAERAAAQQSLGEAYREAGLNPPQSGGPVRAAAPQSTPVQTASTAREPEKPQAPASGGNFFSNLFGGASQPAPQPQAAPKPAPAVAAPSAPQPPAPAAPRVAVAKAAPPAAAPKGAQPAAAPIQPTPSAPAVSGRYRVQLGAVRSRQEAQGVADRVKKEQASALAGRTFDIAEQVFGNMGTFYVVRIGPFAEVGESKEMCTALRAKGIDCQVQLVGK